MNREDKEVTQLHHAYNGFISGKDGPFSSRTGNIIKLDKLLDEAEQRAKKLILEKREDFSDEELKTLSKII
jgi:arginyl-tRNA synthetase